MNTSSLAIIGGGPAGLSAARMLKSRGLNNVTIFEASDRVGGKSMTAMHSGAIHEMGTCYSTFAHRITNRWMRSMGMSQKRLGKQVIDGQPFINYVREEPDGALLAEGVRYLKLWRQQTRAMAERPDDPEVLDDVSLPLDAWLDRHNFRCVRRFMLRAITTMGYGYLDEVAACQALRWCTPDLIWTGVLNQLRWPKAGWQTFWEKLAQPMDVRLAEPVRQLDRREHDVVITTDRGDYRFDQVLVTIPIDDLATVTDPTDDEAFVRDAVKWGGYAVTLCRVDGWYQNEAVQSFSHALEVGSQPGSMLTSRRAKLMTSGPKPSGLYLCGQYVGGQAPQDLLKTLSTEIADQGAEYQHTILQKVWKFFPRYELDAIRGGLLARMNRMQGEHRTWYSGATFSHEAVSNIVSFNDVLTAQMAPRLLVDSNIGVRKRMVDHVKAQPAAGPAGVGASA